MYPIEHAVCLIDDDPEELRRFRDNLKDYFIIGTGTSLREAMDDLRKKGRRKPDLFLLDMYYPEGSTSTPDELSTLAGARQEFLKAQATFLSVLASLRQSSRGGHRLANELRKRYQIGYAFFTRKGTLEDGIEALDNGAVRLIKKPDPSQSELDGNTLAGAYDMALKNKARDVVRDIEDAIRLSNWWWKHREAVFAYAVGFLSSLGAGYLLHFLLKC
jgi:CheY-like chemotaxis protein